MSPIFLDTLCPLMTAALYLGATVTLQRATSRNSQTGRRVALGLGITAVLLNVLVQYQVWMAQSLSAVDVATVMSLCSLVLVVLWLLTLATRKGFLESGLLVMPIAALANLFDAFLPGPSIGRESALADLPPGTLVHVVSSVVSFGVLGLAGVYAVLALAIDHSLKRHELSRLVQNLPPLDKLEHLEFSLVSTGFVLLTVSLASGLLFVDNLMAQHLVHKTVLSFMAWIVFGGLLLGRWLKGWRGSLAVKLTLAGFVLLLLSYFGSKLVLEVILGRSWYS